MAKLVEIYDTKSEKELNTRQLPLVVYDDVKMVMDLSGAGCLYSNTIVRTKEYDKFLETFKTLGRHEVNEAFLVLEKDFFSLLKDTVPCVGCRRSVEKLYEQLKISGHETLAPLVIQSNGNLTIEQRTLDLPIGICNLLHNHSAKLTQLIESQTRSKKSHRCMIHSLEYQRVIRPPWKVVWDAMKLPCREEVLLITASSLMVTLENYLHKHRFCGDCRTKVLKAYLLLIEEPEPTREKGYNPTLYQGIKRCLSENHLHLPNNIDYVNNIVARAQPDVMNSGERHAKTLEVAQGEIITCLGLVIHERLNRIHLRLKEEESTCHVLAAVAVDALSRNFQSAVDSKRGITKLELLYNEITKEEMAKQQRKELKKLKKKKRKEKKACKNKDNTVENVNCEVTPSDSSEENIPPPEHTESEPKNKTNEKEDRACSCEYVHDCGYSSGNNIASSTPSSPEGSEVACNDFCSNGLCSLSKTLHSFPPNRTFTLSLEQMLDDNTSSDEESFIPIEDVRAFQARDNIPQKREELRQTLRMRFAQLCANNQC